jgi:geranylgeranyl diphosphate synthase, type II
MTITNAKRSIFAIRREIDFRLHELLPSGGNLQSIMREMTAQGKRLRPTFVIIAGRLLGCNSKALIDAGCAIEMVHAASLAVDDLPCMDNSISRRGLPAIHVRFGDAAAILGAVALLGRAFQTVTSPERFPLETQGALAAVLARTIGSDALPGGQFDDLKLVKVASTVELRQINKRKTGALFVAGVEAAACVAKVDGPRVEQLLEFAQSFGCAYQMLDDVRDNPRFSSKAPVGVIAEIQKACLALEQHIKGKTRAETNAAQLMNAFLRSVFAQASAHDDPSQKKRSERQGPERRVASAKVKWP